MQENLIKVIVYPKTRKTKKGVKFTTYSTTMNLVDSREDSETYGEVIKKSISVKFGPDVNKALILTTPMLLGVNSDDISAPARYIIKEDEDDEGNPVLKYPVVWINKIEVSAPYHAPVKQSQFVVELEDKIKDEEVEIEENESPF